MEHQVNTKQATTPPRKTLLYLCLSTCLIAATGVPPAVASVSHVCVDIGNATVDYGRFAARLPMLAPGVFPRQPDSVHLDLLAQRQGHMRLNAFHRRGGNLGFASGIDADVQIDARTGLRQFTMTRVDQDCLDNAKSRKVSPEQQCASIVATQIQQGAYTLSFKHRDLNHQLRFTLMQSRENPERWSMVASRRRGEPQIFQLETGGDEASTFTANWLIAHEGSRETFVRKLTSSLVSRGVHDAQFSPFEIGLLSSLSFFDELSDEHRDWVLYNEEVDTYEPPPSPGDEGIYGCHDAGRVCSAEYDTCIPNGDSWLGCNFDPNEPPWGGGHEGDDDIGAPPLGDPTPDPDPNPNPDPTPGPDDDRDPTGCDNDGLPDWVAGSEDSNPRFEAPIVRSAKLDDPNSAAPDDPAPNPPHFLAKYSIRYEITSLLQSGPAHPQSEPELVGTPPIAHVVQLTMRDTAGAFWCDMGVRYQIRPITSTLLAGNAVTYREDGDDPSCILDYQGYYRLHYELDPYFRWFEGAGESGNSGTFRGVILPQQP